MLESRLSGRVCLGRDPHNERECPGNQGLASAWDQFDGAAASGGGAALTRSLESNR